jgi:hypothetical protein
MSKRFEIDEDFVGAGIISGVLYTRSLGVGVITGVGAEAASLVPGEPNAPGILRLQTGTSTNDTCRITFGEGHIVANQIVSLSFRFRLSNVADVGVILGVFDDTLTPVASATARYVLYDTSGPDFITSVTSESGSDLVTSAVAGSTNWRTVTFRISGDGALAIFFITDENGVVLERGVHAAEYVDATAVAFVFEIVTRTGASRAVEIDRVTLKTEELER